MVKLKVKTITPLISLYLCSFFIFAHVNENLQIRTIAVTPYGMNSGDTSCGIYYDLISKVVKKMNYKPEHRIHPYARIIHELKVGKTDIAILFKYKELDNFVTYLVPLPSINNVVLALKGTKFNNVKDFEGKILGNLRGANFSPDIQANTKIIKYETKDFLQSLKMLKLGRVDAVIGPEEAIYSAALKIGLSVDSFDKPYIISSKTPWLQLSNKSNNKQKSMDFKKEFKKLLDNEELQLLYSLYRENNYQCIQQK
jgi:polar amino acid transport system substrate-binding protein